MKNYYQIIRKIKEKIFISLCYFSVILILFILFEIFYETIIRGISIISFELLVTLPHPPGEPGGGIGNAIQGTIILITFASLIGFPFGLFLGIFMNEYKENKFTEVIRFFIETFAEFPSIVIGIFVFIVVVKLVGFSVLGGFIALSLIMIPIVARATEETIKLVPDTIREAAYSLGMPKWRVTLQIVLSYGKGGIISGFLVSLARIAGESAPLLLTVLGSYYWFTSFTDRIEALPLLIFTYGISPYEDWHAKAWAAAFILLIFIFIISVLIKYIVRSKYR